MGEVAGVTFVIWPWRDEWLDQDTELAQAFDEVGLLDYLPGDGIHTALQSAMNGHCDIEDVDGGSSGPAFGKVTITGEMTGASMRIRESWLLETLRERNIAFYLEGESKYEWDGDESWWHPGRDEIFYAAGGNGGRFLDHADFAEMCVLCMTVQERLALIDAKIEECEARAAQARAEQPRDAFIGASDVSANDHVVGIYEAAIVRHREEAAKLIVDDPAPRDLAALVTEFFAHRPLDWRPGPDWAPALVLEDEAS